MTKNTNNYDKEMSKSLSSSTKNDKDDVEVSKSIERARKLKEFADLSNHSGVMGSIRNTLTPAGKEWDMGYETTQNRKDAISKELTEYKKKGGVIRGHGCETKGKTKGRFV